MSDGLFKGKPYGLVWDHLADVAHGSVQEDWDLFLSNAHTLKHHMLTHGVVPTWEMAFCGGTPELANPQSYTWGWPSLFIYLFDPFWAFVLLWFLLSLMGLATLHLFLRRHGIPPLVSLGVGLAYVGCGYFAARFNVGHFTFAFFHFIPIFLLVSDVLVFDENSKSINTKHFLGMVVLSFLFFSATLPVALFYFYPALIVFLMLKFLMVHGASRTAPWRRLLWNWGVPHGMGMVLASYKWVPVLLWQRAYPRGLTEIESASLGMVLTDLWRTVPSFHEVAPFIDGRPWGIWENFNYIGAPFILFAVFGVCLSGRGLPKELQLLRWAACILMVMGLSLSLGNSHVLGLGSLFGALPFFDSIRSFSRYGILLTFGILLASARALTLLHYKIQEARWRGGEGVIFIVLSFALAPLFTQSGALIKNVTIIPSAVLQKVFPMERKGVYTQNTDINYGTSHPRFYFQTHLFHQGRNVIRCNQPLTAVLDGAPNFQIQKEPLVSPAPSQIRGESDGLSVFFDPPVFGEIKIRVPFHPVYELEKDGHPLEVQEGPQGGYRLETKEPVAQIRIRAQQPGITLGFWLSVMSAVLLLVLLVMVRREEKTMTEH